MKNTIKIILASLPVVLVMSALTAAEERPYAGGHGGAGDAPPVTIEQTGPPQQKAIYREIHPPVRFLDRGGQPVVDSGGALSFMKTCGQCHDTEFIAENNYHATAGLYDLVPKGSARSGRPWDTGPGIFGRWSPLVYRTLTPPGSSRLDMGVADWVRTLGARHVGGGPAERVRDGRKLTELPLGPETDPATHVIDPETGRPVVWDWEKSGTVELNCALCHMEDPNNVARIEALEEGKFRWASTATLEGKGMVLIEDGAFIWQQDAFDEKGHVKTDVFTPSQPTSRNCMLCHARACRCEDPVLFENSEGNWMTETTGEVFSHGRISDSGMNVEGRSELHRPWDVHAERLVQCWNCHYSLNNPLYNEKAGESQRPAHLMFDARKLERDKYLYRPSHNFAKGHTSQGTAAPRFYGTMRDCRNCHDAGAVHEFLPYKELHFEKVSCQTCHINRMHAPVRRSMDWTVLLPGGRPVVEHRGVEGPVNDPATLITGYKPLLLLHEEAEGEWRLGPHNLMTTWFWVGGDPPAPVRIIELKKAYFGEDETSYHPDVLKALDRDGDGELAESELVLDAEEKVDAIKSRLEKAGVNAPRIMAEVQPYTLSHGVAGGEYALSDCKACHDRESIVTRKISLSERIPGGVMPEPVKDANVRFVGSMIKEGGKLFFEPSIDPEIIYVHGTDRIGFLDILGILSVVVGIVGAGAHGVSRIVVYRRRERGRK